MSEVNALADRLFDTILDRYPVDASLMGFDRDHESLVDHSEEADQRYRARLHEVRTQSDDIDGLQIEFGISANIRTSSEDGSRPGTYFVNTNEPQNRLKIEDEATAYHEAVPGHHFEYSKVALLKDVPVLRRKAPISEFGEGWALYCERLADEMGLYSSDESRLGMLTMDAMRAGRLVVDTGLHSKGWSRQQAIDYLVSNTPMGLMQIESEVDRYLGEPGQALAYIVEEWIADA